MSGCDSDRLSWSGHSIVLANSLYRLYMQSSLLDVRLVCDEAHIYAHKAVLAAGSQFFLDRLQTLGPGMVELQVSTASLGMLFTPNDLRAVVEYLYCGELLVPHHRLPQVLALVRCLQVFGFQNDTAGYITGPEPQYLTPADMNYVSLDAGGGLMEVVGENSHLQVDENCGGLTPSTPLPLVSIKPHDPTSLQDPPKYSEPLKIDTNVSILGHTSSMSFSELCTAPGADGDGFASQCSQVKNVPSVFESSVLGEATTVFKKTPECSEGYSKPDRDVLHQASGSHFRQDSIMEGGGGEGGEEDLGRGETGEQRKGERSGRQQDPRQTDPCAADADQDDTYNTVMLLEALVADASVSGVDMDTLLQPDESRLSLSPRWVRSRRPLRPAATTTDSRARLKVKDSIGGVSLQDTSQRQDAAASAINSVSPEDEMRVREGKESWMVVLPETPRAAPNAGYHPTLHPQVLPDTSQLPKEPPPLHIQSPPVINRAAHTNTLSFTSPLPLATPLLAPPSSCPSNIAVHPHPSHSTTSTLPVLTSIASPAPLIPQSNLSLAPYLQSSVLPAAVVNQTDFCHVSHTLPALPIQTVSVLEGETPVSFSQNVAFSQPPSSPPVQILSQSSSLLHIVDPASSSSLVTGTSVSHATPVTQSLPSTTTPVTLTPSPSPSHIASTPPPSHITNTPSDSPSIVAHFFLPQSSISATSCTQTSIPSSLLPVTSSVALTTTTTASSLIVSHPVTSTSFVNQSPRISTAIATSVVLPPSSDHPCFASEIASSSSTDCVIITTPPVSESLSNHSWPSSHNPSDTITTISLSDSPPPPTSPSPKSSNDVLVSTASTAMVSTSTATSQNDDIITLPLPTQASASTYQPVSLSVPTTTGKKMPLPVSSFPNTNTTVSTNSVAVVTISSSGAEVVPSSPVTLSPAPPSPILVLEDEDELEEQRHEEDDEAAHRCSQCVQTFKDLDTLTLHLWDQHEIGTLARCQLCEFSSPLQSMLVKHAALHITSGTNICAVCKKQFKTRATMRTHLRAHRGEEVMYKCDFCPVMYSQRNNLIKHLASKHCRDAEGRPLTQHLTCPHCSFTTLAEHKLKAHIVRRHTVDKPFKCESCSYATTEKTALAKHKRTHTKERPYVCETCGLHAPTLSSLWRHRRSHTGEKPYECEQCGQQYADSKRLRDHMYKHNNIKPFMCHMCGYTCRRKDNLQTHLQKVHKLHDHKDATSRSRPHTLYQQTGGKSKRRISGGSAVDKNKATPDATQGRDTIKIKTMPGTSKPQLWTEPSYDNRSMVMGMGDGVAAVVAGGGSGGSGGGGEVEATGGRDILHPHTPFTSNLPPSTLQTGPGCVAVGGSTSTLQLGYILPLPAPPDPPTMALASSADGGIILVGQHP